MDVSKILVQLMLFLWLISDQAMFATENRITIERLICSKTKPESKIQALYCSLKYINRTNMKLDAHWNITGRLEEVWVHGVFYHKFNGLTYHKFPIDLWENVCDWLDGKSKSSFILDWTMRKLVKYSNFNHACPYEGYVFAKCNNISIDEFLLEPLVPSGRYRIDVTVTESKHIHLCDVQLYFSVSDHRIEVI